MGSGVRHADPAVAVPPMPVETIHVLLHGYALCGQPGIPGDWPPGHLWVSVLEHEEGTCEGCKRSAWRREAAGAE